MKTITINFPDGMDLAGLGGGVLTVLGEDAAILKRVLRDRVAEGFIKVETMKTLTIQIPDDVDVAKLDGQTSA